MAHQAEIGVFGGSGLYRLLDDVEEVWIETPYGAPSDRMAIGTMAGRRVAFLPRHGKDHRFPPHGIPYRANAWAMKALGVRQIVGPCAVGSLQPQIQPGHFVFCDQLVDRTSGRKDTFFDGPLVRHITFADPYCPDMRRVAVRAAAAEGITTHNGGTMVVIQGPRFSTRAESSWFSREGWTVVGMTQHPEVVLCRELGMHYLNISLVTDHDVGLEGVEGVRPVSHEEVLKVFAANIDNLKRLLARIVAELPDDPACECPKALPNLDH